VTHKNSGFQQHSTGSASAVRATNKVRYHFVNKLSTSHLAWTTLTRWCMAWPTVWFGGCSQYRTPLLGLSQERNDKNTSRQCYASCTGFQSVNECGSNWPVSCTSHYLVRPPVPGRWCPATCWQRSASTSISQLQSMRHSTDTEQFRRQSLFCCRT